MPTTGAPFNIFYPDGSTPIEPLENVFLTLANSITTALGDLTKIWVVANLAAIDALTTAKQGDLAWMTTPGTGIDPILWEAFAGSGSGLDWRPIVDVISDTKAHLDTFISAVAAIADTRFHIGRRAFVTGTKIEYRFTSAIGALTVSGPASSVKLFPTATIAGTGASATVTEDGEVQFSATTITSLRINLADLTQFRFIDVTLRYDGASAGAHTTQVVSGAAPNATASSYRMGYSGSDTVSSIGQQPPATQWGDGNLAPRRYRRMSYRIYNLADARETFIRAGASYFDAGGLNLLSYGFLDMHHSVATSYDGLLFTFTGMGAITNGSITIEGHI